MMTSVGGLSIEQPVAILELIQEYDTGILIVLGLSCRDKRA